MQYSEVVLRCVALGDPAPVYTWRKLPNTTYPSYVLFFGGTGLYLYAYSNEVSGTYVCNATNAHGSVEREIDVQVIAVNQIPTPNPNAISTEPHYGNEIYICYSP